MSRRFFCRQTLFLLTLVFFASLSHAANCDDAMSAADDAYTYARRGYRASDLDNLHYYARKAKSAAQDAYSYASSCGCYNAASEADDSERYARRAYNEEDFDYAQLNRPGYQGGQLV